MAHKTMPHPADSLAGGRRCQSAEGNAGTRHPAGAFTGIGLTSRRRDNIATGIEAFNLMDQCARMARLKLLTFGQNDLHTDH